MIDIWKALNEYALAVTTINFSVSATRPLLLKPWTNQIPTQSTLEMQVLGPTPTQLDQDLHFHKTPGWRHSCWDLHTHIWETSL